MNFLGPPRDWIERFGRHFIITEHTHLQGAKEREILPWLRISAELDPQKIETYTVAAYWLRDLGKAGKILDLAKYSKYMPNYTKVYDANPMSWLLDKNPKNEAGVQALRSLILYAMDDAEWEKWVSRQVDR